MKRVLPSTIRRPHRLPPRPDCPVYVSSRSSCSFVPRVSLSSCSTRRRDRNDEKRNSPRAESSSSRTRLSSRRILLLFCFEPGRWPGLLSSRLSARGVLSSSSRFVSSRLYCSRVRDQNPGAGILQRGNRRRVRWYPSAKYNFPTRTSRVRLSPCAISANLVAAMNWKTRYVPRVDFQFAGFKA